MNETSGEMGEVYKKNGGLRETMKDFSLKVLRCDEGERKLPSFFPLPFFIYFVFFILFF